MCLVSPVPHTAGKNLSFRYTNLISSFQHADTMETGILEEPDLTLVSLNTTHCSALPDSQQDEGEPIMDGNNVSGFISSDIAEMEHAPEGKENIQPSGKYIQINIPGRAII